MKVKNQPNNYNHKFGGRACDPKKPISFDPNRTYLENAFQDFLNRGGKITIIKEPEGSQTKDIFGFPSADDWLRGEV